MTKVFKFDPLNPLVQANELLREHARKRVQRIELPDTHLLAIYLQAISMVGLHEKWTAIHKFFPKRKGADPNRVMPLINVFQSFLSDRIGKEMAHKNWHYRDALTIEDINIDPAQGIRSCYELLLLSELAACEIALACTVIARACGGSPREIDSMFSKAYKARHFETLRRWSRGVAQLSERFSTRRDQVHLPILLQEAPKLSPYAAEMWVAPSILRPPHALEEARIYDPPDSFDVMPMSEPSYDPRFYLQRGW